MEGEILVLGGGENEHYLRQASKLCLFSIADLID